MGMKLGECIQMQHDDEFLTGDQTMEYFWLAMSVTWPQSNRARLVVAEDWTEGKNPPKKQEVKMAAAQRQASPGKMRRVCWRLDFSHVFKFKAYKFTVP